MLPRDVPSRSHFLWLHTHGGRTCPRIGERIIDSSAGRIERNSALVDYTSRVGVSALASRRERKCEPVVSLSRVFQKNDGGATRGFVRRASSAFYYGTANICALELRQTSLRGLLLRDAVRHSRDRCYNNRTTMVTPSSCRFLFFCASEVLRTLTGRNEVVISKRFNACLCLFVLRPAHVRQLRSSSSTQARNGNSHVRHRANIVVIGPVPRTAAKYSRRY